MPERPSSEQRISPYGSWQSPISLDMLVDQAVKLEGVLLESKGEIYFSEIRPHEKGRSVLLKMCADGQVEEILPSECYPRTRVHEYGGGSILITGGEIYFSNFSDQQLYRRDAQGKVVQFTHETHCRFADGCCFGGTLYYVMEVHGNQIENCLVAIDRKTGVVKRIATGCDFYASPRVSPDGKQLAYYCWNNPNMPWDGGELRVAELQGDGTLGVARVVAGGPTESIPQLTWGPDGALYFVSDRNNWWNLYREKEGQIESLYPMEAEFGWPQWTFGQSNFDFWGDKLICMYFYQGSDRLGIVHEGTLTPLSVPYTSINGIYVEGDHLYFRGTSPSLPPCLIQYNLVTKESKIIRKARELQVDLSYLSQPQTIEFLTTHDLTAHAFYYPPKNPHCVGPSNELPPLIVMSHGGPTAHHRADFNLEVQYWTSRGIAVLDVNYGGSSGYGRAYRDRLIRNWGTVDVDDCTNGALYCAKKELADRERLAIKGGSAGGYTTLACLAFRDVFKAGASYFGVSDLEALVLDTHKFEACYLDGLVGLYPEEREIYLERSPIHHVDQIKCPIILLQGDEDKIVPPNQSEKMYQSLLKRGIPTAYLLFEQEQHGFRQAKNIKRALEAEAYFFSKIFGFQLADPIKPVEIANYHE